MIIALHVRNLIRLTTYAAAAAAAAAIVRLMPLPTMEFNKVDIKSENE